jgi:signal transduction histidine kinase
MSTDKSEKSTITSEMCCAVNYKLQTIARNVDLLTLKNLAKELDSLLNGALEKSDFSSYPEPSDQLQQPENTQSENSPASTIRSKKIHPIEAIFSNQVSPNINGSLLERNISRSQCERCNKTKKNLLEKRTINNLFVDAFRGVCASGDLIVFKRSVQGFPVDLMILLFGAILFLFRPFLFGVHESRTLGSYLFYSAYFFHFLSLVFIVQAIFYRFALISEGGNSTYLRRFHASAVMYSKRKQNIWSEHFIMIFSVLTICVYILANSLQECSGQFRRFGYHCLYHGIPHESLYCSVICVLVLQTMIKSASRFSIIFGWITLLTFTNVCTYLVGSGNIWINIEMGCLVIVSIQVERNTFFHFKSKFAATEAETNNAKLKLQNEVVNSAVKSLRIKRSMVRHFSHEMRTPLNTVTMAADVIMQELLSLGKNIPESLMEVVLSSQDSCNTALGILNELLDFEKLAAGLYVVTPIPVAIHPLIREILCQFDVPVRVKGLTLELLPSLSCGEDAGANVDPVKIFSVFTNLLSNAIKFTNPGGHITLTVEKNVSERGNFICISVKDDGAGISRANISSLFQEGVQFHANELQGGGGSGFGLYIAKGIVDLHYQGSIWAESEGEGCGTTFSIAFPFLTLDTPYQPIKSRSRSGSVSRNSTSSLDSSSPSLVSSTGVIGNVLHVLVVDDSVSNRKMMKHLLTQEGHECVQAENGLVAVTHISRMMCERAEGDHP